jgi:hypothetical protein
MSNTLTAIIPTLQDSANIVGRELVGFIPACHKNASANRAGYNQTVNYSVVPTLSSGSVSPAATSPAGTDIIQAADSLVMDNLKKVSWNWTGEERRALSNGDIAPYQDIISQTLQQAMRTLVNEIENSLWVAAYKGASAAFGAASTTPFATSGNYTEVAGVARILDDNGTPALDRHLVVGAAAMANLRGVQANLFKVNEAGSSETLRKGSIGELMGFEVHNSYPITTVTAGTQAAGTTDNTGYAVGATTLTLASAGTGTIVAGDIVVITGDGSARKYVVKTGDSSVADGGTMVLNRPGLKGILSAATHAITTTATSTRNIALHRSALHLVMRAPDDGDDSAEDVVTVQDPHSGLVFQLARYGQYMQSSFELRALWGVKAAVPDFIAVLLG